MQLVRKRLATAAVLSVMFCAVAFVLLGCANTPEVQPEPASSSAPAPAPEPVVQDKEPEVVLPTEPYYVLLVGNDSREGTVQPVGTSHADTIMIVRVDPITYQVSLLTVPRDTSYMADDNLIKMCEAYSIDGINTEISALEEHTGLKFKYYFDFGFKTFVDFYNEINGLDVSIPLNIGWQDIITGNQIDLEAGENHLNGNELLVFARVRKLYYHSEAARQNMDRSIVQSSISAFSQDASNADKLLDSFLKYVDTNWDEKELRAQVADFCAHADKVTFQEGTLPYEGGIDERNDLWMCYEDPETTAEVIKVFSEGGDPTTIIPKVPMDPA